MSTSLARGLLRGATAGALTYGVVGGVTYTGILMPQFAQLTLAALTSIALGWLFIRWRKGWQWHVTPLDGALLLWALAFTVSLLANLDVWRRSAIALWYISVYVGMWALLQDTLANRGLTRAMLIEGILIAGAIVLAIGFVQLNSWAGIWLPLMTTGTARLDLPRMGSTFGNPNTLGNFLVVLIPLVVAKLLATKGRRGRAIFSIYAAAALLTLLLTFSRGAWLATGAALVVQACLMLAARDMLSLAALREWWRKQSVGLRAGIAALGVVGVLVGLALAVVLIRSLAQAGRTASLRESIYGAAWQSFVDKPLYGQGLFTFGRQLAQAQSMPPRQPHSHAHNLILHVAAELGVVGLVALAATGVACLLALRRSWRDTNAQDRVLLAGAIAAVVGSVIHHQTDVAAMLPAIAVVNLVALIVATAPVNAQSVSALRQRGQSFLAVISCAILLALGWWSSSVYSRYDAALKDVTRTADYADAAAALQPVINADPSMPVYLSQQGFLYGLAAAQGDADALDRGIAAFERYIALEPYYANGWANLAALYWQQGEHDKAVDTMGAAANLAPEAWSLAYRWGIYAEEAGDGATAREAYRLTLQASPDAILLSAWDESPLRREIGSAAAAPPLTPMGEAVWRLERREVDAARAAWAGSPSSVRDFSDRYVMDALLALAAGERESALRWLAAADRVAGSPYDEAWVGVGLAALSRFDGDDAAAQAALDTARGALVLGDLDADFSYGANVNYIQFLRTGFARQFLPAVGYEGSEPALLHLLGTED